MCAPNFPTTKDSIEIILLVAVKCEHLQSQTWDKDWGTAAMENLQWAEKATEMPTQTSVSECLIVPKDPFLASQGRPEWMPIIPPNSASQQYFYDVPFVESRKALRS